MGNNALSDARGVLTGGAMWVIMHFLTREGFLQAELCG